MGQDPLALIRAAAAAAVTRGDWSLVDKLRAILTPPPLPDNVSTIDAARRRKS